MSAAQTAQPPQFPRGRLGRNLLVVLLPLVVGPLLLAAPFLFTQAESDITTQIVGQLRSVAAAKEGQLQQWADARTGDMRNLAAAPDVLGAAHGFVFEPSGSEMAAAGDALRERFEHYLADNSDFEALLLVDARSGEILLTTDDYRFLTGQSLSDEAFFSQASSRALVAPVRHYPALDPQSIHLMVAAPVIESGRGTIALVVGLIPDQRILARLESGLTLGESERFFILTSEGYQLGQGAGPAAPRPQSEGIRHALGEHQNGSGVYVDHFGEYVVGVYDWLPEFEVAVLLEKNENAAFAALTRFTTFFIIIGAAAVALGAVAVLFFTRRLTRPILALTERARRMAAGDLQTRVNLGRRDEIGELDEAFNSMAAQLQEALDTLEQRVADRTVELARASEQMRYRAAQLQTVAEVARVVTSEPEPEQLLPLVTELIAERFRFYHVGVFLLDEADEYAVLRAANSEGGQLMLERGHKLRVGQTGIVGYVAARGEARIALDVGLDAVFFDNPHLPLTRSEMAVPLKVADRVIGVLDVQSQQAAAFTEEDASLLGVLADQVAIAIENARLFAGTRRALVEVQSVHRQYLEQEWGRWAAERGLHQVNYRYTAGGVAPAPIAQVPEAETALRAGEVVVVNRRAKEGNGQAEGPAAPATLAVPIKLRGQVIGVIDLQRAEGGSTAWAADEVALVQAVTDDMALALENARLLEQTMRRAQREKDVAGITDRIYSATDARSILQIAAEELRRITGSARAVVRLSREQEEPGA